MANNNNIFGQEDEFEYRCGGNYSWRLETHLPPDRNVMNLR